MTTILVSGSLTAKPYNGGEPWVRLSWVQGLRRLGFDVYFVEQIDPSRCVDAQGRPATFEDSINASTFARISDAFVPDRKAALISSDGSHALGPSITELRDIAEEAALLINITGHLTLPGLIDRIRTTLYVDEDPGYTQMWRVSKLLHESHHHDHYYTVGLNLGSPRCTIPSDGIDWHPVRQPVVLGQWPRMAGAGDGKFTTVASWRGTYGAIEYDGKRFGPKAHAFRRFRELPQLTHEAFEIALDIHAADSQDLAMLHESGWQVVNPKLVAPDPDAFRCYVQRSDAEFSVAQGVYVETQSGWFSDRSARYLASGRPVLVQDTGLDGSLPTGQGLVTFSTLQEAVAGAQEIRRNYTAHSDAARAIAEEYFDSDKVLGRLVEEVGIRP